MGRCQVPGDVEGSVEVAATEEPRHVVANVGDKSVNDAKLKYQLVLLMRERDSLGISHSGSATVKQLWNVGTILLIKIVCFL